MLLNCDISQANFHWRTDDEQGSLSSEKKNLIMDLSPNVGAILEMKVDVYPRIF